MKALLIICSFFATGCSNAKKSGTAPSAEKTTGKDSLPVSKTPHCIDSLIKVFKAEEVQNPPRKVYRYSYNNKTVYYVPAICCDFYSDLYDEQCNLISHPDGGFTGNGSGKTPDFHAVKRNEELIWEDKRK